MNRKKAERMILTIVLTAALMAGCGSAAGGGALKAKASEYDFIKEMMEKEAEKDKDSEGENDGVLPALTGIDCSIELAGKKYTIPFDLSDLLADGWTGYYDFDAALDGRTQTFLYLTKDGLGDQTVDFTIFNGTGNAQKLRDCKVAGIQVTQDEAGKAAFSLSNGLTVGDSIDTVKEKMGLPTSVDDNENYTELEYGSDVEKGKISFYWDKRETYNYIEVEHYIVEETESSEEVPDYLHEYTAPSAMGEDFDSGVFSLDGVLYRLSCPLYELTGNGWKPEVDKAVAAGTTEIVYLHKNGATLVAYVRNYADYQVPASNCALYQIGVDLDLSSAPDLLLPKGFKLDIDLDTLESILDSSSLDFEKNDTHEILTNFSYLDYSRKTSFFVSYDKENKRLYSIKYSRDVWP